MRLKKKSAAAAFQSQLSTILEKLVVLAVEEIKELVLDYCEELSREKTQIRDLSERNGGHKYQSKENTSHSFSADAQDGHTETQEQMTLTDTKKGAEKRSGGRGQNDVKQSALFLSVQDPINCNLEEVAVVSSENPPSINQEEDCSFILEEAEQCFEKHFGRPSPGDSKDHLRDYNRPVQTHIHTSQHHSPKVDFQIKQEEETPGFGTGRNIDNNCNVNQGISYDTYARSVDSVSPLDIPGPMQDITSLSLPDPLINKYTSSQENQSRGHFESLTGNKQIKKYSCDFCNKAFCYPSDLKHHRRWHTQERTHVCGICGKGFITKSHLRRHELMHLDMPPSVCHICGYKTPRLASLKVHMRMHNNM